jgi:fibronectin type 3 domain-containing protein
MLTNCSCGNKVLEDSIPLTSSSLQEKDDKYRGISRIYPDEESDEYVHELTILF